MKRVLLPHALVVLAILAWANGRLSEPAYLTILAVGHLVIPLWAIWTTARAQRWRAFLLGPGTAIVAHGVAIALLAVSLVGGAPEGTWISWMIVMLWGAALAVYVAYCAIVFGIAARR
ncbi:MAG: hypothetical protein K8W52_33690 [Deltaproteobacteria bacterium]|nr:hypothetical protein [Deltaproteobacteria bacterium]